MLGPRQGDERLVAVVQRRAHEGVAALEPEPQVGVQAQLEIRDLRGGRRRHVVALGGVGPLDPVPAVVELGIAVDRHLDRAVDAADRPQQDVVGVVVVRCAPVRLGPFGLVVPAADQQDVPHDHPARPGLPGRLEDHRAGHVAACRRDLHARRRDAEVPGVAVEHRAEDRRAVHAGQAHPLDGAPGGDEGRDLAVREEPVVPDRGEGTPSERQFDPGRQASHPTSACAMRSAGT